MNALEVEPYFLFLGDSEREDTVKNHVKLTNKLPS